MPGRPGILLTLLALAGAGPSLASGPELVLGDACVDRDRPFFEMTLHLTGEDNLPSSLRTTIVFDPTALEVWAPQDREPVRLGPFGGGDRVMKSWDADPVAGTVDLVFHTEGRQPVPALAAGALAHIGFRLRPEVKGDGVLRVDIDPGQTRSLDGNNNENFTGTVGPAYIWMGRVGPWIQVDGGARTQISASGELLRDRVWILRGRLSQVEVRGGRTRLGPLERLPRGRTDLEAEDGELPGPGDAFFYMAAQPDAMGRPLLGFGSDCQVRVVEP